MLARQLKNFSTHGLKAYVNLIRIRRLTYKRYFVAVNKYVIGLKSKFIESCEPSFCNMFLL